MAENGIFPPHAINHSPYAIDSSFSGRGGRLAGRGLPNRLPPP